MHSDRTGERRWHIAIPAFAGALAFAMSALPETEGWYGIAALSVAAAAGIALITSFGSVAGYVSPWLSGLILDSSGPHGMELVLLLFVVSMLASALLTLVVSKR